VRAAGGGSPGAACQDWSVRKSFAIALILPALALPFTGCSDGRQVATPPACMTAAQDWVTALAAAPDRVLIDQASPISDCLPKYQGAAQIQEVGNTAVEAATQLSAFLKGGSGGEAGQDTESSAEAALMAGYLVGALENGAADTRGIHDTLVQRVKAAATNHLGEASPKVRAQYRKGREAGLESG
jgi:hypothetical protein